MNKNVLVFPECDLEKFQSKDTNFKQKLQIWKKKRKLFAPYFVSELGVRLLPFLPLSIFVPSQVKFFRNIPYKASKLREHKLDIFVPKNVCSQTPTLIYFHGGGFTALSKEYFFHIASFLAARGITIVNINYRRCIRYTYPNGLEDACDAVSWVVQNIDKYSGNKNNLIFAGESSGANFATSITIMCTFPRPENYAQKIWNLEIIPQLVIPICGMLQVSTIGKTPNCPLQKHANLREASYNYLSNTTFSHEQELDLANPLIFLEKNIPSTRKLPQFFIPVGEQDPLISNSQRLATTLTKRNVPHQIKIYKQQGHAFHFFTWRKQAKICLENIVAVVKKSYNL